MLSLISILKESQKNTFQDINKIYKISLKSYSWFLSFILLENNHSCLVKHYYN